MKNISNVKDFILDKFEINKVAGLFLVDLKYHNYEYYLNIEHPSNLIDNIILKLKENKDTYHEEYKDKIIQFLQQMPKEYFDKDRWVFDKFLIHILERPISDIDTNDEIYGNYVIDLRIIISNIEYRKTFLIKPENDNEDFIMTNISTIETTILNIIYDLQCKGLKAFEHGNIEYNNKGFQYIFQYNEFFVISGRVRKLDEKNIQFNILNSCKDASFLLKTWEGGAVYDK